MQYEIVWQLSRTIAPPAPRSGRSIVPPDSVRSWRLDMIHQQGLDCSLACFQPQPELLLQRRLEIGILKHLIASRRLDREFEGDLVPSCEPRLIDHRLMWPYKSQEVSQFRHRVAAWSGCSGA